MVQATKFLFAQSTASTSWLEYMAFPAMVPSWFVARASWLVSSCRGALGACGSLIPNSSVLHSAQNDLSDALVPSSRPCRPWDARNESPSGQCCFCYSNLAAHVSSAASGSAVQAKLRRAASAFNAAMWTSVQTLCTGIIGSRGWQHCRTAAQRLWPRLLSLGACLTTSAGCCAWPGHSNGSRQVHRAGARQLVKDQPHEVGPIQQVWHPGIGPPGQTWTEPGQIWVRLC